MSQRFICPTVMEIGVYERNHILELHGGAAGSIAISQLQGL